MLMALGFVVFVPTGGINTHAYSHERARASATHQVIGLGPVYEDVGEDESPMTIEGKIFPEHESSGNAMASLAALDLMRSSGIGMPLMRGDGAAFGWFKITSLKVDHASLAVNGLGREQSFTVSLKRAPIPSAGAFLSIFGGLQ